MPALSWLTCLDCQVLFSSSTIAYYKYCCRGLHCSACPTRLHLRFGAERILVHDGLAMDCQERYFNTSFDTFQQEGTYQINVSSLNFSYLFYN